MLSAANTHLPSSARTTSQPAHPHKTFAFPAPHRSLPSFFVARTRPPGVTSTRPGHLVLRCAATAMESADAIVPLVLPKRTFIDRRGNRTNFVTAGCGQPVILVHGFGASAMQYKKNIAVLSKNYKVYALDLLGFGKSAKPYLEEGYSMEIWRDQILDFMAEFVDSPAILVGNSFGSLACLMVNAALPPGAVRGTVLLNCAGAMNNKGLASDDWRIALLYPVLILFDVLLKTQVIATWLFGTFANPKFIRNILSELYCNQEAVDDALVDSFYSPSCDPGAIDVFVSVLTGPPGPRLNDLVDQVRGPLLVIWGDKDIFTPLDGPSGRLFEALPAKRADTTFELLHGVGHCLHDDRPEMVHAKLLPWMESLNAAQSCPE